MTKVISSKEISNSKLLVLFTLWSFLFLLLFSPDSPLFHTSHHIDSAWFFMEGKALMNGLRPYVDFSDCKGPLLWVIYGIGYLISPRNFWGVYIVGSIMYTITLFYNYKMAKIFLEDQKTALLAVLPMMFVYFFPWFHYEVRSEDMMLPFISISLYLLFKRIYKNRKEDRNDFLGLGACFMALTMIKYNISAIQGIIVLIALWEQWREKRKLLDALLWAVIGALAVALPIIAYLLITGTFEAFIHDYFVVAFEVVAEENSDSLTYANDLKGVAADPRKIIFIIAIALGGILLGMRQKSYKYLPLAIGLLFVAISTRHNVWNYYYGVCYVFIIFLFISTMLIENKRFRYTTFFILASAIMAGCLYGNLIIGELRQITIFTQNPDKTAFQNIADVMKSKPHAKLLNYECNEFGFGIPYEALPAGNQYACQNGATPEMMRQHKQILHDRKADFVITYCREDQVEKRAVLKEIEDCGYTLRHQCIYMNMPFYIYEKE